MGVPQLAYEGKDVTVTTEAVDLVRRLVTRQCRDAAAILQALGIEP